MDACWRDLCERLAALHSVGPSRESRLWVHQERDRILSTLRANKFIVYLLFFPFLAWFKDQLPSSFPFVPSTVPSHCFSLFSLVASQLMGLGYGGGGTSKCQVILNVFHNKKVGQRKSFVSCTTASAPVSGLRSWEVGPWRPTAVLR